jgi:hypothetical protein
MRNWSSAILTITALKASVEEISAISKCGEKIIEVLKVIQAFDPAGVGARDLRECLMLQLEREGEQESLEYEIVRDYMEALGKRRIPEIARGTGASVEEVQESLAKIARLEPRPGRAFLANVDQFFCPKCSSSGGDDLQLPPTTSTFHICASATFTRPDVPGREYRRSEELHPREDSRRQVSYQESAPAAKHHRQYRPGNRQTTA